MQQEHQNPAQKVHSLEGADFDGSESKSPSKSRMYAICRVIAKGLSSEST